MLALEKSTETTPVETTDLGNLRIMKGASSSAHENVDKDDMHDECSSTPSHDFDVSIHAPHKPLALRAFHSLEFIAIVASLRVAGTQLIPLFLTPIREIPIINLALRLYISLFCIGICLIEFEVPIPWIQESLVSQSYLTRGLLYTFLALVAMKDAAFSGQLELVRDVQSVPWAAIFTELTAWPIFIVGHVYILLGVCCAKPYRDRLTTTFQEQMKEYHEAIGECNDDIDEEELYERVDSSYGEKAMPMCTIRL